MIHIGTGVLCDALVSGFALAVVIICALFALRVSSPKRKIGRWSE